MQTFGHSELQSSTVVKKLSDELFKSFLRDDMDCVRTSPDNKASSLDPVPVSHRVSADSYEQEDTEVAMATLKDGKLC